MEHWSEPAGYFRPSGKNTQPCGVLIKGSVLFLMERSTIIDKSGRIYQKTIILRPPVIQKFVLCLAKIWSFAFLKCQGMFACAIFDVLLKRWILARDPVGIKPLYFQNSQDCFAFASEIKPLLKFTQSSINKRALPGYLQRRFVMGGETLFSKIFRVKPAETLEFLSKTVLRDLFIGYPKKASP